MHGDPGAGGLSRRSMLARIGGATAALGGIGTATRSGVADETGGQFHNPTGPPGFGDVSVIEWSGTYYVYGTGRAFARSDDLVTWEPQGKAVDWDPDWHGDPEAGFWAPDVNRFDDRVYLYYSHSTWGSQDNPGIGVATADHPEGPFTDHGPVFRNEDLSQTNCIDSELVVLDGTPYLIWGSFFGIWGVELTPDGMDYVPGTAWQLAGDNREGAMLVRENDYFYLFCSTGHCCDGVESTYEIEVGRSESLFGPYRTRDGRDLRTIHDHHAGQAVLSPTEEFVGTGHNTAIRDAAGDWWMLYHIEALGDDPGRRLMVDRIRFDDADWPVVGCDGQPCREHPRPTVDSAPTGPDPIDGTVPRDLDGDGRYEDLSGDETLNFPDVNRLFQNIESASVQDHADAYDFSGDGTVDAQDVLALFESV
ncbi:family 43 glycosylhydrolase [Halococcoides cellulosivorans]|uniref:EF-hand domain-containing protein n=1 Tax=Halococcoides cellulosivorans TaxID=1679096 RepID=A0A2R4X3G1_9EURY|nr:family 43 glycosylhydrolase [Halococcoides cellulosivorans]AWB28233.1 hypothetical protein HARCEL1_11225 [Halococcoides cellulosivorans]